MCAPRQSQGVWLGTGRSLAHWDGWGMAVEPASFNGYDNALTTEDDSLICSESSWSRITTPAQAGISTPRRFAGSGSAQAGLAPGV